MKRTLISLVWSVTIAGAALATRPGAAAEPSASAPPAARVSAPPPSQPPAFVPSVYRTFAEWHAACIRLPSNRSLRGILPPPKELPLATFGAFEEALDAYLRWAQTGTLARTDLWVGTAPSPAEFFDTGKAYFLQQIPFQPYAQKLEVAPRSTLLFHGDFHGDIRSLVAWLARLNREGYLEGFRVVRSDTYVVFLGDYVDRGNYGMEVLYTLFRLKLENPERVFLLRGNHEDLTLTKSYGFLVEGTRKYGRSFNAEKVLRAFDFLPAVLYVGCGNDFLQCNHGGMEPGYQASALLEAAGTTRFQLLGALNQSRYRNDPDFLARLDAPSRRAARTYLQDFLPTSPISASTLGFLWNDFSLLTSEPQLEYDAGRAFVYGQKATRYVLERSGGATKRLLGVFRGHQHSGIPTPIMTRLKASGGVYRHWQAADVPEGLEAKEPELRARLEQGEERALEPYGVWTFNVAPDSVYGEGNNFDFDAWGILTTGARFTDWRLRVHSAVPPK